MEYTEKVYPDWVQQFRTKGTTVKKKGDIYYLYKRTSKRVPGKKYPQPVDTYIGVITPEGIQKSGKKKLKMTDIEVYEYGFSKAMELLCPEGWKNAIGKDWEEYLKVIIQNWSPGTYLNRDGNIRKAEEFPYSLGAQSGSLTRRIYREYGIDWKELEILKTIYLVRIGKETAVSRISEEQQALLDRLGIRLEVS